MDWDALNSFIVTADWEAYNKEELEADFEPHLLRDKLSKVLAEAEPKLAAFLDTTASRSNPSTRSDKWRSTRARAVSSTLAVTSSNLPLKGAPVGKVTEEVVSPSVALVSPSVALISPSHGDVAEEAGAMLVTTLEESELGRE